MLFWPPFFLFSVDARICTIVVITAIFTLVLAAVAVIFADFMISAIYPVIDL